MRSLRSIVKAVEGKRDELVRSARAKISVDEAREVIIDRLRLLVLLGSELCPTLVDRSPPSLWVILPDHCAGDTTNNHHPLQLPTATNHPHQLTL